MDGTPLLDIKPYISNSIVTKPIKMAGLEIKHLT